LIGGLSSVAAVTNRIAGDPMLAPEAPQGKKGFAAFRGQQ